MDRNASGCQKISDLNSCSFLDQDIDRCNRVAKCEIFDQTCVDKTNLDSVLAENRSCNTILESESDCVKMVLIHRILHDLYLNVCLVKYHLESSCPRESCLWKSGSCLKTLSDMSERIHVIEMTMFLEK